jgi:hypothetical protein
VSTATRTPEELAENLSDYMATSITPWPDERAMREAVRETVRLIFAEARHHTLAVLGVDALRARMEEAEDKAMDRDGYLVRPWTTRRLPGRPGHLGSDGFSLESTSALRAL